MAPNTQNPITTQQQDTLSMRDLLSLVWRLRYWIILSAFVALVIGFVYAHMQNRKQRIEEC